MGQILKKYTIIPEHLYVNRKADVTLKSIIVDMQRPGYVLVARQMGKTNLLLHAKRTLENEKRHFVYIDLSNRLETQRACYRYMINAVVDSKELFRIAKNEIADIRAQGYAPHDEYFRSLKEILNVFEHDIIMILDEIDALRTVNYSDHIFAQIRSNYFSRSSFKELNRLTYILSGVIEPAELIKDHNKSPFNIGEKIYLEDFTKNEYLTFIKKSQLHLKDKQIDEIFKWANGNPRMTFDICSSVESKFNENGKISTAGIRRIIRDLYLDAFDTPPVDHIRELVKSNMTILKAIKKIKKRKAAQLTAEVINKLFLYGIINNKKDIQLKNKIIKKTLSKKWLKSVQYLSTYDLGLQKMKKGLYEEAIDSFVKFTSDSAYSSVEKYRSNFYIGMAYYQLGRFNRAEDYFAKKDHHFEIDNLALSQIAGCMIQNGEFDKASDVLRMLINFTEVNNAYRNALFLLAPMHINDNDEALCLYEKLFDSCCNVDDIDNDTKNKFKVLSLYHQADILLYDSKIDQALLKLKECEKYVDPSTQVFIEYQKTVFYKDIPNKDFKENLVNHIIDNQLKFEEDKPLLSFFDEIEFNEKNLFHYLVFIYDQDDNSLFERLLRYSIISIYENKIDEYEIVFRLSKISSSKRNSLLKYILSNHKALPTDFLIRLYSHFTKDDSGDFLKYSQESLQNIYLSQFITISDVKLFSYIAKLYSKLGYIENGLNACINLDNLSKRCKFENKIYFNIYLFYWYAKFLARRQKSKKLSLYLDKVNMYINDLKSMYDWSEYESDITKIKFDMSRIIYMNQAVNKVSSNQNINKLNKDKLKTKKSIHTKLGTKAKIKSVNQLSTVGQAAVEQKSKMKHFSIVSGELALRIQEEDVSAENEFVMLNYRWLLFVVERIFSQSNNTEDIVQDAFMLTIIKLRQRSVRKPESILGFLRTAAIQIGYDYLRKDKKFISDIDPDLMEQMQDLSVDFLSNLIWQDMLLYVKKMIAKLQNKIDQEILLKFYFQDEGKVTICNDLKLSHRQFDRVIFRAKLRLKEKIENKCSKVF